MTNQSEDRNLPGVRRIAWLRNWSNVVLPSVESQKALDLANDLVLNKLTTSLDFRCMSAPITPVNCSFLPHAVVLAKLTVSLHVTASLRAKTDEVQNVAPRAVMPAPKHAEKFKLGKVSPVRLAGNRGPAKRRDDENRAPKQRDDERNDDPAGQCMRRCNPRPSRCKDPRKPSEYWRQPVPTDVENSRKRDTCSDGNENLCGRLLIGGHRFACMCGEAV